jgi:leucyl/phenylalanyl-tRNA--protein transferase
LSFTIPVEELLWAYANGYFPMGEGDHEVLWYRAPKRGIIPLESFRVSKNVHRLIKKNEFSVSINQRFEEVIHGCANRDNTWINEPIIESYVNLHQAGFAHSVEIMAENNLLGGLYGVALRGAFFGESMFRVEKEMDKIALFFCHQVLSKNGFTLWDTQFYTEHLGRFGAIEIDEADYLQLLKEAMKVKAVFSAPISD